MKPMSENQYDFKKIHLTNGLTNGYDKGSYRKPVVITVFLIVALGVGWAVIS